MTGGIDTSVFDWMSPGVALEFIFFFVVCAYFTATAMFRGHMFWYMIATAAWVIFAIYEFRLADVWSPHWALGLLALFIALLTAFSPFLREPDSWIQRLDNPGGGEIGTPPASFAEENEEDEETLDDYLDKPRTQRKTS